MFCTLSLLLPSIGFFRLLKTYLNKFSMKIILKVVFLFHLTTEKKKITNIITRLHQQLKFCLLMPLPGDRSILFHLNMNSMISEQSLEKAETSMMPWCWAKGSQPRKDIVVVMSNQPSHSSSWCGILLEFLSLFMEKVMREKALRPWRKIFFVSL